MKIGRREENTKIHSTTITVYLKHGKTIWQCTAPPLPPPPSPQFSLQPPPLPPSTNPSTSFPNFLSSEPPQNPPLDQSPSSTCPAPSPLPPPPPPPPKTPKKPSFFYGGAHYGDLLANLLLGFTLLWLPLTLAAVLRAFFLRYRFTNLRVTVISGLTGQDRSDFSYKVIKDVQVVPRFIGEWGDIIITLKDGSKVDLRSVPKFREIAKYCLKMAEQPVVLKESGPKGF